MKKEIESFIKDFVKDLQENNAAIFAGAGLSRSVGYVNWAELLTEIAEDLGLQVEKENLMALAQYHVNENSNKTKITRKILEEFAEITEPAESHKILARLPITTYWTTNYDTLIEDALKQAYKIADVKYDVDQLANTRPKRDAVVYKMHGHVEQPNKAIITKEQYENYHYTHAPFITALSGDLISKTFLFIGFSFTDPNLDYVLSRLSARYGQNTRTHYCFIRKHKLGDTGCEDQASFDYNTKRQQLMINDLKRYGIKVLLIDDHLEILDILKEIERRFKKKTVFISGSAIEFGKTSEMDAQTFIHLLSKSIVSAGFRIVNGFGLGVGSAVINGALDGIYSNPQKLSEEQLVIKPFPQVATGKTSLKDMWEEYRQRMIGLAGIALFVFGNKREDGTNEVITAPGVLREFQIAKDLGLIPIPIACTGYTAKIIFDEVIKEADTIYGKETWIADELNQIASLELTNTELVSKITKLISKINK